MTKKNTSGVSKNPPPFMHGVIDYRQFFEKVPAADPVENLTKYPTDILIVLLAKINAIIFAAGGRPDRIDNDVFPVVFDKLDKRIYDRLKQIHLKDKGTRVVFTPQAIVGLMAQLIARYRPVTADNDFNEDLEILLQMDLFEAILIINDIYYNSDNYKQLLSHKNMWQLELLQQQYARAITNIYGINPFKLFLFFRFIEERFGEDVIKEFAKSFGVPSAYNFYFVFLQTIAASYSVYEQDRKPRFQFKDEALERILQPFIIDPSKEETKEFSGESFALINQPFYKFPLGIVILDFELFAHLTDVSLIYHFYHATSLKTKHGIKTYNEYLGMIGKYFYEEYITLQLIKRIFSHRYDAISTEKDDPLNPDILVIQNNKDVFVIEVKSSRVHGKVLDRADTDRFKSFLENSFANEKGNANEKNKGIFQLKKQIQHLKSKGNKFRIFPIIVYTEPSMDIAGVNSFLEQKFDEIISEDRSSFTKIHPLTLINLHFFIKYYPQLKSGRYFLRDKILEYHEKKKSQLKEVLKTKNPFLYFTAENSFMRAMEQTYPAGDPMNYFKILAKDFGFKVEDENLK